MKSAYLPSSIINVTLAVTFKSRGIPAVISNVNVPSIITIVQHKTNEQYEQYSIMSAVGSPL